MESFPIGIRTYMRGICFLLTYRCTARCKYCSFECSPDEHMALDLPVVQRLVTAFATSVCGRGVAVFSGGEPTLCWDTLIASIKHASKLSLTCRVVSNGHWATTKREASETIAALANAGLKEINFTTGTHHTAYIPLKNVIIAAETAILQGLRTVIVIEEDDHAQEFFDEIKTSLHRVQGLMILRAEKVDFKDNNRHNMSSKISKHAGQPSHCEHISRVITVTPDGQIYPCCGLRIRNMPRMAICSVEKITEYLNDQLYDTLFSYQNTKLALRGPLQILTEMGLKAPAGWKHPCELCELLYMRSPFFDQTKEYSKDWRDIATEFALLAMLDQLSQKNEECSAT